MRRSVGKAATAKACLLVCGSLLLATAGCKTQQDAALVAQQMTATTATLSSYYASLAELTRKTEEAHQAQQYLLGVSFPPQALALLETTRGELSRRAAMADDLARVAALFAEIQNATAAADAAKAATDLSAEVSTLKLLKANSTQTDLLRGAVDGMVHALQAHDEVKAAQAIAPLAEDLARFFASESDAYVAVADGYYATAASNARVLCQRNQVAVGDLFASSLEPFGLKPDITDSALKQSARPDLSLQIGNRLAARETDAAHATADLNDALHVMSDRVADLASHRALRTSLPPLTLAGVRAWIDEARKDVGE